MIGVSYELFWGLNPKTMAPFIKAFELKKETDDFNAWQQGLYIRMAIASCLDAKAKYPELPVMQRQSNKIAKKDITMSPEEIKAKMFKTMNIMKQISNDGKEE